MLLHVYDKFTEVKPCRRVDVAYKGHTEGAGHTRRVRLSIKSFWRKRINVRAAM